jgi:hypothetical protein
MANQLHVDPAKIRISVRPHGELWTIKVESRQIADLWISSTGIDPVDTTTYVLRKAAIEGMQGVRLG